MNRALYETTRHVPEEESEAGPETSVRRALLRQLRPAILLAVLLTLIVGIVYPLVTTGTLRRCFPRRRLVHSYT